MQRFLPGGRVPPVYDFATLEALQLKSRDPARWSALVQSLNVPLPPPPPPPPPACPPFLAAVDVEEVAGAEECPAGKGGVVLQRVAADLARIREAAEGRKLER